MREDPARTVFESVLDIIKEYEIARRERIANPGDEARRVAFERAADDLESLWCHYSIGNLTREACLLVDFFLNFLLWESNVTGEHSLLDSLSTAFLK